MLSKYKGKEHHVVIQTQFESLTKEQIFSIFGEKTYGDHKKRPEISIKFVKYRPLSFLAFLVRRTLVHST
ncbi:hypothetical protein C7R93_29130 [Brevibacillus fortis]|uniref:Uncharacterized protein n=1 Tax=Brevibacillus fortis TaxID=2126352 RepID=A0A2P7UFR0_9BACL|nr:hypothetical protein C7R93_29130 [Brevibacillus fortis]